MSKHKQVVCLCVSERDKRQANKSLSSHAALCFNAAGLLFAVGTTTNLIRNSPQGTHTHHRVQSSHAGGYPPTHVVIL